MSELYLEPTWIDLITRESGYGSLSQAVIESLIGLNNRGYGTMTPQNNDHLGLTLFTRPRLNLSYDSLSAVRSLTPLLTTNRATYQQYFRDILDPVGLAESRTGYCPFLNPKQAFIPLLSNNLLSLSGWPDRVMGSFTSAQGNFREEFSMVDDHGQVNNSFDLTGNFRNMEGDPITAFFSYWYDYMSAVYQGTILPHDDSIYEQEIDYQTAIYRLVVSPDYEYVHKWAKTIAYPSSIPTAMAFNYDHDRQRLGDMDQVSIQFRCVGAEFSPDVAVLDDFNKTVAMFNPDMLKLRRASNGDFVYAGADNRLLRIEKSDRAFLNFYGYPHVDIDTGRLSWFIDSDVYDRLVGVRRKWSE